MPAVYTKFFGRLPPLEIIKFDSFGYFHRSHKSLEGYTEPLQGSVIIWIVILITPKSLTNGQIGITLLT